MTEYTMRSYPTEYRGRRYRSRLEARWAAFFDQLRWEHEYEPMDLGAWSPDFLLTEFDVLVEVKPITEAEPAIFEKALGAAGDLLVGKGEDGPAVRAILLLGLAPRVVNGMCQIGWWGGENSGFVCEPAILIWTVEGMKPKFMADIASIDRDGFYCASGDAGPLPTRPLWAPWHFPSHALELWAHATGIVQWKAPA